MSPEEMVKLKITVEHGWLCIRHEPQWLLWSKKMEEVPPMGFTLESVKAEMEEALALHRQAVSKG